MDQKECSPASKPNPLLFLNTKARISLLWVKRSSALFRPLSINILREICEFIATGPMIALCRKTCVVMLEPLEMQVRSIDFQRIRLPLQYSEQAECVCIREDQVFMCGGGELRGERKTTITSAAFLISSTQAVRLKDMQFARIQHALYYDQASKSVLVFAGNDQSFRPIKKCEEYDLTRALWSPLPDKRENRDALLCGYQGKVYFCGWEIQNCEVFTIATKLFTALSISLIPSRSLLAIAAWNNQLLVFQTNNVRRLDISSGEFIEDSAVSDMISTNHTLVHNDLFFGMNNRVGISLHLPTMTYGPSINLDNH